MEIEQIHIDILDTLYRGGKLVGSDRKEDRARQKLKNAGLIICLRNPRRWEITEYGKEIRAKLQGKTNGNQ